MNLSISIEENIYDQFYRRLGGEKLANGFIIDPKFGTNQAKCIFIEFPESLELYHFGSTCFKQPVEMSTTNSIDSKWYLIHINLSRISQTKSVGDKTIYFQRNLPIGILLCGPGLTMNTVIPEGVESEVLSIRFHKSFIESYIPEIEQKIDLNRAIAYEDIDQKLGTALTFLVKNMPARLACHAHLLSFMNLLFDKLSTHQRTINPEKLHPDDLKRILEISALLRNPLAKDIPPLRELAEMTAMGITKFKDCFKLVFGLPPLQYRKRIRMEYAREELMIRNRSISDLSFELGYAHPSNFTAAFKQHFGRLPSSF